MRVIITEADLMSAATVSRGGTAFRALPPL